MDPVIPILLVLNFASFLGIMLLHWLAYKKFPDRQSELLLVCLFIGIFFFLLLLFVYVPVIRNKKGKYEGP